MSNNSRLNQPTHDAPALARKPRFAARLLRFSLVSLLVLVILLAAGLAFGRYWMRHTAEAALPQLDGALHLAALTAPVTVLRDAQGVPHIHASTYDDLLVAQGYVTAQDRLFQMDLLRRHAAGELAEILGPALLPHDKQQRTLQIRASAEAALRQLPPDQIHMLERYAAGVNASIADQSAHLPLDYALIQAKPRPWTPLDSVLLSLMMVEDLAHSYPQKLAREQLTTQLTQSLGPAQAQALLADMHPVGSWRDHPPSDPIKDLTVEGPPIEQVPLDESQSSVTPASAPLPKLPSDVLAALIPLIDPHANCPECRPGSNDWVISGAHTASGKPMLSNDMHLAMTVPGLWYENDLESPDPQSPEPFHVAGVSLPGVPLIVVGHNQHIAWGMTVLGADIEDLYLETLRGEDGHHEFRDVTGAWQPVVSLPERIHVKGHLDTVLNVEATRHGSALCPILTPILPGETRPIALRSILYDPVIIRLPVYSLAAAHDWASFHAALATFYGPSVNIVYADDQGHIGYQAAASIPLRGPAAASQPAPADSTPDPSDIQAPRPSTATQLSAAINPLPAAPSAATEWSGYIPYEALPHVFDPPGGVIATANARITPDDYPYPITLDWTDPYRNERIWRLLAHRNGLKPADMLAIQMDIYSDFDHVLAQRLAYALDHSDALAGSHYTPRQTKRLRQAADLLRVFNGRMTTDSVSAALLYELHRTLWAQLLGPRLHLHGKTLSDDVESVSTLYHWGERDYALEQIVMHQPPRWLPAGYANWNDFLTDALERSLTEAHAPNDLTDWRYGKLHTLEVEDPILGTSQPLRALLGLPAGTGKRPLSGNHDTIKQVDHAFGPSERLTVDLADPDRTTLNVTMGQSGNPASPHFLDQFPAWLNGTTFPFPFSDAAAKATAVHTLTLTP